ncbi:MAG: XRE family transcriptional regulator, partial [Thermodesulfobacteriaceae bacterium]|nr:XRE family transcriptional regulator [Thermodesulfobacteriaceae bacterium]
MESKVYKQISERLKILIQTLGLSLRNFAKMTNIPYRTLQNYTLGISRPNLDYLEKVCSTFGVNLNWLLTGEGEMFYRKPRWYEEKEELKAIAEELGGKYVEPVPVLGYVPAGFPSEIPGDAVVEWVALPEVPKGCVVLKAKGDSMFPLIKEGDYLIVRPLYGDTLPVNKVVIYRNIWGETAVKRLRRKGGKL